MIVQSGPPRWLRVVVVLALAVGLVVSAGVSAQASTAKLGGIKGIGGKCVSVVGGDAPANGARIQLSSFCGDPAQQWWVVADGSIRAFGMCLDVDGGQVANGTKVQLWDCNGTPAQQWRVNGATDLTNPHSAACLDATGLSSADGTLLQIWACTGAANQQWTLPTFPTAVPDRTYIVAPRIDAVQLSGTSVTVRWTDMSIVEGQFDVLRRVPTRGPWTKVGSVVSTTQTSSGTTYSFVDTVPDGDRQCYTISVFHLEISRGNKSNEMCTSSLSPLLPPPVGAATISPLDTAGISGVQSSIAFGHDSRAIISYYEGGSRADGFDQDLRVAHCDNAACSSVTTTDLDTPGDVGEFSSIKIGADGFPLISYVSRRSPGFTSFTNDLKVAHCLNMACTSSTVTTVDADSHVDSQTSLTIGADGFGLIAYYDQRASVANLMVAHCRNPACTQKFISIVDTVNLLDGNAPAITTNTSGDGIIAYVDGPPNNDLKVAVCGGPDCSSGGGITVDENAVSQLASIMIGRDSLPLITYRGNPGSGGSNLKVAHCVNILCTGVTTVVADAATVKVGSVQLGVDGLGVISYTDLDNKDVKVAHCTNLACSAVTTTTIDQFDDLGTTGTSIAISGVDGLPLVAYQNVANGDLMVARCGDVACVTPFSVPF